MAETLRIEIPIETVDKTEPELSQVTKKLGKLGEAAKQADSSAKKASESVTLFDRQAQKIERILARWAKEKYQVLLEAKEKISPLLSTVRGSLKGIAGKSWSVTLKAVDLVTTPVRGILNLLKNPLFSMGAVLGVSIGMKDSIETYMGFEAAMSQVEAISGATGTEMVKLTEKAKEMGATTKFTAQESAEAFNYMAMAGWKTDDMLSGIEGILNLAAASGEDLALTSDIVTDALTAFGLQAGDSAHFADVLAMASSNANTDVAKMGYTFKYAAPLAGALGYTIEDTALAIGMMANAGIKSETAGTALRTMFSELTGTIELTGKKLGKYVLDMEKADGSMVPLRETLVSLREAFSQMSDAEQAANAESLVGKEAMTGLLAIVNETEENFKKLTNAVDHADGASARMAKTMQENLKGAIDQLQSAVDGVKISFGGRLAPYIGSIAGWLTEQMPDIEHGLDELMDWFDKKVDRMKRKFAEVSTTQEWQEADFFGKVQIAWDEFIAEPFAEWWSSTGKAKFAGFAKEMGSGIGADLKMGIMTLLGINLEETLDEGVSIGTSFARGFSEGFDFQTISGKLWEGFQSLLSNAGSLFSGNIGISSVLSAMMLGKAAGPLFQIGKGVAQVGKGLFGTNAATGTSLMGSFLGSAASGTGLLGKAGMLAIHLGAGNLAGGASMSAGALSATGMAAGAGAIAAGATLVSSALDAYKAIRSDDKEESKAYGESAAWKAGGVAAGAAAGALIGSVIPGIGTAVGALAGAGVGGIAGWIKGNTVKEAYQDNVEQMELEAEKAKKVLEATGQSIKDVTFENKVLQQAMEDSSVSAAEFAQMFQEECANVAKKAFGDIRLSLAEVKKLAAEITFADMAEGLEEFSGANAAVDTALAGLQDSIRSLKKENWKVGLGMELSELDRDSYQGAVEDFVAKSRAFIDSNHYEVSVALKLLVGEEADTSGLDSYYASLTYRAEYLGTQLATVMSQALEDGMVTPEEAAGLSDLQEQLSGLTDKLAEAKDKAGMKALQVKYNGAALEADSFHAMLEELQANSASAALQYEDALTVTLTDLELRLADNAITQEAYDEEVARVTEGYYAQIKELDARVSSFGLEGIATAFDQKLAGILPEIEGTTAERLRQVMEEALAVRPDVQGWSKEEVKDWFGLSGLSTDDFEVIFQDLLTVAEMVPEKVKEALREDYLSGLLAGGKPSSMEELSRYMGGSLLGSGLEADGIGLGQLDGMLVEQGNHMGSLLNEGLTDALAEGADLYRAAAEEAVDTAFHLPFEVTANVTVTPNYLVEPKRLADLYLGNGKAASGNATPGTVVGTDRSGGQRVMRNASGGYVSGGPQLSWLAEEGYGEFVIPTNPSRRARALELYEQAGTALGVAGYAAGGYVGTDIGEGGENYEVISAQRENAGSSIPVQVMVSMAPEFVIQSGDSQSEETILQVVKRHLKEMADELSGEIAGRLEEVFSDMPLREA